MLKLNIFSNTISTLENSLNQASLKQKVVAQNIANADTPNYKAKDVSFKSVLQSEMAIGGIEAKRTDVRHYSFAAEGSGQSGVIINKNTDFNHNGNNVDMDKEMSELAENQIYYNALVERISGKFTSLQNVIRGGR
ncbi:flagellar basal-body rod protein B [Bacillus sp. NRRL B-14911]|nr:MULTISPECIES: flagellar basal body rod protein FlgB [Bacillus]EAR65728.1 flagellar basal-body rod protein B [Bacillus sp. NRRL B-14911]